MDYVNYLLIANKLRISFARSVDVAGNNEPPSGTNGLQVRREAQDFCRGMRNVVALFNLNLFRIGVTARATMPNTQ